ncbi:MAG TPA: hypothetical protein VMV86_04295 [Methanosarcinales archaeon]|nr:hypothetical protein [Methanosarcinales archaeon]
MIITATYKNDETTVIVLTPIEKLIEMGCNDDVEIECCLDRSYGPWTQYIEKQDLTNFKVET